MMLRMVCCFVVLNAMAMSVRAERYELDFDSAPANQFLDRWVYPFNGTPGTRIQAPTFGALGSPGFDDRDGQYLLAINTEALGIPVGAPASAYQITAARLLLTEAVGGYRFDPTYDGFRTYLDSSVSGAEADTDAGRPIELFGAGLRNDYEEFGWPDGTTSTEPPVFSSGSPYGISDRATRNAFATDAFGVDVSNNIDSLNDGVDGFDPIPFSIGQAIDADEMPLSPGTEIDGGTVLRFDLNLAEPAIDAYVREGLARGQLGFVISSLHDSGLLGEGDPFVNLATSNHFAVDGPQFEIDVTVVDVAIPGDFDGSGMLDVGDIDLLSAEIVNGTHDSRFDVNQDNAVNQADLNAWVTDLFGSYIGDANLDGEFNSSDFVEVFKAGQYEDGVPGNSTWATGDWKVDLEFDSSDFVEAFQGGGYELGPHPSAVPEPACSGCLALVLAVLGIRRRLSLG